jgi:hypothetical protein
MPGPTTSPSPIIPGDPTAAIARFTISVGDTVSSRVNLTGYTLRHLRFPSGVTASSVTLLVSTSEEGTLVPVRDVGETADYSVPVVAGKQVALSWTASIGAHPVVALGGNTAQTGSDVVIEATLVKL